MVRIELRQQRKRLGAGLLASSAAAKASLSAVFSQMELTLSAGQKRCHWKLPSLVQSSNSQRFLPFSSSRGRE